MLESSENDAQSRRLENSTMRHKYNLRRLLWVIVVVALLTFGVLVGTYEMLF